MEISVSLTDCKIVRQVLNITTFTYPLLVCFQVNLKFLLSEDQFRAEALLYVSIPCNLRKEHMKSNDTRDITVSKVRKLPVFIDS